MFIFENLLAQRYEAHSWFFLERLELGIYLARE